MSNITEENVDDYKIENECDEHWKLRRKFLLVHKDKFSSGGLQSLSQVFTKVEFLGCRYPEETMKMIAELSKEVIQNDKEKSKNRLQLVGSTFVEVLDAAKSKCTGISRGEKSTDSLNSNFGGTLENHMRPCTLPSFKRKQDQQFEDPQNPELKKKKINPQDTEIVLIEHANDCPTNMLGRLGSTNKAVKLEWKFDKSNFNFMCTVLINGQNQGQAQGDTRKEAKQNAAAVALVNLQKRYYTIRVTKNFTTTVTGLESTPVKISEPMSNNNNIGMKMMKKMGWSGGGLGKASQGIVEPISVEQKTTREGLGLKKGNFQKHCRELLQNYINAGDSSSDLVFSPSFSSEEKSVIQNLAKQFGLTSQLRGPHASRTLRVSRKMNPAELVHELLELGGSTEKYELIEPTGGD